MARCFLPSSASLRPAPLAGLLALAVPTAAQDLVLSELRDMLPPREDVTRDLELVDLDGDGDLDLFTAAQLGSRVYLFAEDGGYAEVPGAVPPLAGAWGEDAEAADLNGDGNPDVLLIQGNPYEGSVLLGDGAGGLALSGGAVPFLQGVNQCVDLADLDADGDLDAIVGVSGWFDRVLLNQDGAFLIAATLPGSNTKNTQDVRLGDVNSDGVADVFRASFKFLQSGDVLEVLIHDGALGFTKVEGVFPEDAVETKTLEVADLDGDGDLDVLAGRDRGAAGGDLLYAGDGNGGFAPIAAFPGHDGATNDLVAVDYDGDLDLDVLAATGISATGKAAQPVLIYENLGGLGFGVQILPLAPGRTMNAVASGDVDLDGDVDALLGGSGPDLLLLQSYSGELQDASGPWPSANAELSLVTSDWNGDGLGDAAALSQDGLRLFANEAGTGFVELGSTALADVPSAQGGALAAGDFDLDGFEDLLVLLDGAESRLLRGDGNGGFTWEPAALPADDLLVQGAEAGDLDGDGDVDVYLDRTDADRLLLNDGAGAFALTAPIDGLETGQVALGDLDGDGDLDAYRGVPTFSAATDTWVSNDGAGAFAFGAALDAESSFYVALFDREQDGDLDVLGDSYFDNDGLGGFTSVEEDLIGVNLNGAAALSLDVDGDGDLDVFLPSGGLAEFASDQLLINDGLGVLTAWAAGVRSSIARTETAATVDWDGDGDTDVLLGSAYEVRLLSNVSRELARRAPVRLGKPLVLDVFGPPGTPWAVAFGATFAQLDLGALGVLRLDPGSLQLLAGGLLDGAGLGEVTAPFPTDPALLGLTLGAQAVVGNPLVFTNLEPLAPTSL